MTSCANERKQPWGLYLPTQSQNTIMFRILKFIFLPFFFFAWSADVLYAQEAEPFSCFSAQEIHFPIDNNDFSKSKVLKGDKSYNAMYYLYEDKRSFWYKFIADRDITINFSVSPTNDNDSYRAVVFDYGSPDFCERLIGDGLQPVKLQRQPIILGNGQIIYKNQANLAKGDTLYVSVLSLNLDDCGHFLYLESEGQSISFNAIHQPCYNFDYLEIPDFSTARKMGPDVEMDFDRVRNEKKFSEEGTVVFDALKTIEIQSKEDDFISVGDKLVLNEVFFYSNTYAFKPDADLELDQLVDFLLANATVEIEVQGHSANSTAEIRPDPNFKSQGKAWNFKGSAFQLSEKRAEAVRNYLIDKGISKKRLTAKGYGDSQKRVKDATSFEDFEKNMRVEALVIKQ